jgi:hypothetical protein
MKTADRENPNRWVATPSNRAHGAEGQNRPCSTRWAAKQEKLQPLELCFFLTSPFRELIGSWPRSPKYDFRLADDTGFERRPFDDQFVVIHR